LHGSILPELAILLAVYALYANQEIGFTKIHRALR